MIRRKTIIHWLIVGFQQQRVLRILPAQINQHAALTGDVRGIA